jgi:sortase A
MYSKLKNKIPMILVVLGCSLILITAIYEISNYPLFSLLNKNINEVELADPTPPTVEFVRYEDSAVVNTTTETASAEAVVLPGDFEDDDEAEGETSDEPPSPAVTTTASVPPPPLVLLGSVKIPRINISENLFMGTERQINFGIGHLNGSPMPGKRGNSVIAAHRTAANGMQPFRHLDKMQNGDFVIVEMGEEAFTYEVYDMFIVPQDALWVLQRIEDEPYALTLITCDPVISSVRNADRLIVRARLVLPEQEEPQETEHIEDIVEDDIIEEDMEDIMEEEIYEINEEDTDE